SRSFLLFLLSSYPYHRDLHSFPTRRSSDLSFSSPTSCSAVWRRPRRRVSHLQTVNWNKHIIRRMDAIARSIIHFADLGDSGDRRDRKSTRLNSSHVSISYAVFCLKKKKERI